MPLRFGWLVAPMRMIPSQEMSQEERARQEAIRLALEESERVRDDAKSIASRAERIIDTLKRAHILREDDDG